jgi:hypothetical protein
LDWDVYKEENADKDGSLHHWWWWWVITWIIDTKLFTLVVRMRWLYFIEDNELKVGDEYRNIKDFMEVLHLVDMLSQIPVDLVALNSITCTIKQCVPS